MKKTIVFICAFTFVFYSNVLKLVYPHAENDYSSFVEYYYTKIKIEEGIFMLLFLVITLISKRWLRSIALFGFIMTFGSFVDKVFFGFNDYLYSDVILIVIAMRLSWFVRNK